MLAGPLVCVERYGAPGAAPGKEVTEDPGFAEVFVHYDPPFLP
jgi:hypothetical protein